MCVSIVCVNTLFKVFEYERKLYPLYGEIKDPITKDKVILYSTGTLTTELGYYHNNFLLLKELGYSLITYPKLNQVIQPVVT